MNPYVDWTEPRSATALSQGNQDFYSLPDWPPVGVDYPSAPLAQTAESTSSEPEIGGDLEVLAQMEVEATQAEQMISGEDWTYTDEMTGYPEEVTDPNLQEQN